jgi:predicted transcriptional regulator of viral defense system
VKPHVPDAWIDTSRRDPKDGQVGLVGYESNFNRYFYRHTPPRPLEESEGEIRGVVGFFRAARLEDAGLTRDHLPALLRSGRVERVGRGLYRLADAEPTENYSVAMACARVPNSIVCLLTALRIHGIGTQAPAEIWLAIPHKARKPRPRELKLRTVRFSGPAWTLGVQETTFEGVPARITSPARTVADCFRFERLVGPEAAMEALQDGLRQRKVTIAELSRVVEVLPSRRLAAALDVRSI